MIKISYAALILVARALRPLGGVHGGTVGHFRADAAHHAGHPGEVHRADTRLRLRQARRDDPDARRRQALHRHRRAQGREGRADPADAHALQRRRPRRRARSSPRMLATLPQGDEVFVADGYIRVFQDVRGKYGSEGDYVMTRPLKGPLNPSDGRSLHRRLRHHRLAGEERARVERQGRHARQLVRGLHGGDGARQSASRAEGGGADEPDGRRLDGRRLVPLRRLPPDQLRLLHRPDHRARRRRRHRRAQGYDDYENFRRAGSAGDFAKAAGLDQLPLWRKIAEHPAYDAFWQEQALDKTMAAQPLTVPTMWIQGHVGPGRHVGRHPQLPGGRAEGHRPTTMNFLVMGPWRHSGVNYDGSYARPAEVRTATPRCSSAATC